MAATRKLAEVVNGSDIIDVVNRLAAESGLKLETIIKGAGLTADDYEAIVELSADLRIGKMRDLCRAAGAELCIIQSSGHAPWTDRHSPTSHPARLPGLHDHHLTKA